ncbi:hypothetical protein Ahy_B03g064591 [Arachis hypogaea]|uniref:Putative plant transposon protein domain-containing protein n=1 Tax=Arachis hypogaea TaxID=3818 RepID=A0A444ZZW6_ARAHY|nr:hypothetical protein Ahy_B03g064591 [Arachis hypogaea]
MLELRDLESRILRRQEEDETKFKELRVRVAGIVEAVGHLTSHLSSCAISTSIVGCGEATPELSKDTNIELHGEEEELNQEPQQEEKIEISEQKEVVDGCLGYVEYIKESQVEETSSKECGGSIKEETNVAGVNDELKEIDKEVDSISNDFLPTSINSLNNPVEPSPSTLESKQPPHLRRTLQSRRRRQPPSPRHLLLLLSLFFPFSFTAPLLSVSRCLCATRCSYHCRRRKLSGATQPPRCSAQDLGRINISWVKEFYCNFFRQNLDSVHLRGREIMITEDAFRDALLCRVGTPETCAYQQAEVALLSMTFDYEALRRVIATPDASWVMDSSNTKPKGMLFAYLTREARTWQQIFAHYVFPTTHFSEIPMDMLVLIGCVMEGKEVYFPRLIRHSMWRAHIRGLLLFPTLVTSLAELADVPWEDEDVTPPPPDDDDKEVTIPWGVWVHEKPLTSRRSRARAVVEAASPSSSTAAGPSSSTAAPAPPSAPEPTYLLVQHLLRFMERFKRRVMRHLDRLDQAAASQGIELPPLPEHSASDEQDQEEEHGAEPTQKEAPPVTQTTPEVQHDIPEPQPVPPPMTRKGKEKANPLARPPLVPSINEHQVKEFYANFLKRDAPTVFLRGVSLDTSDTALEALLDISHIPLARDAYTQIMKDVTMGKISLDVVLEKIGQAEARWEYNKGDNAVLLSIVCTDLNPEARIWQQIIADYILPRTHATYIRVRVAVLLWAILEGRRISMWKVNQQQKYNILFPSLITKFAALSGVERRLTDRTSVHISKQLFLPYGDYDGPPQKKRKTTEPPSSAAVHRYERRNARCFQWIVAKFEGRDPGPPPPDTPEPEAKETHLKSQRLKLARPAERTVEEPRVEEPAAGPEPIVEMAVEITD